MSWLSILSKGVSGARNAAGRPLFAWELFVADNDELPRVYDGEAKPEKKWLRAHLPSDGANWLFTLALFAVIYTAFGWWGVGLGLILWLLL